MPIGLLSNTGYHTSAYLKKIFTI